MVFHSYPINIGCDIFFGVGLFIYGFTYVISSSVNESNLLSSISSRIIRNSNFFCSDFISMMEFMALVTASLKFWYIFASPKCNMISPFFISICAPSYPCTFVLRAVFLRILLYSCTIPLDSNKMNRINSPRSPELFDVLNISFASLCISAVISF